jgi:hypothetical protein
MEGKEHFGFFVADRRTRKKRKDRRVVLVEVAFTLCQY